MAPLHALRAWADECHENEVVDLQVATSAIEVERDGEVVSGRGPGAQDPGRPASAAGVVPPDGPDAPEIGHLIGAHPPRDWPPLLDDVHRMISRS
jgi:hypothetical protein